MVKARRRPMLTRLNVSNTVYINSRKPRQYGWWRNQRQLASGETITLMHLFGVCFMPVKTISRMAPLQILHRRPLAWWQFPVGEAVLSLASMLPHREIQGEVLNWMPILEFEATIVPNISFCTQAREVKNHQGSGISSVPRDLIYDSVFQDVALSFSPATQCPYLLFTWSSQDAESSFPSRDQVWTRPHPWESSTEYCCLFYNMLFFSYYCSNSKAPCSPSKQSKDTRRRLYDDVRPGKPTASFVW